MAHRPAGRLSGGEQQRLAVAVALANGPQLLLADEPTSQLDQGSAAIVIELIRAANQDLGTTVVVVTHDPAVGSALGRTVTIRDGRVGAEGHAGEEYLVVSRDGSVQLPAEVLEATLPPGTLARAVPTADGVRLHRADPGGADVLEARGIRYSRDGQLILDGIDLTVAAGESLAVTGPSGSGKTSLLAILSGLAAPASGEVYLDGTPLTGFAGPSAAWPSSSRVTAWSHC